MQSYASKLPKWVKYPLKRIFYYRNRRFCPICGKSSRRFRHFGRVPRKESQCPYCGSLERHRLLWLYLSRKTDLFDGAQKKMLHIAPEPCLEPRFKKWLAESYLTADLFNPHAMVKMDITNIAYPDQSFDVIYCSHVLEHVHDDRKAMREFFRVLKDKGWAILLVPIYAEKTFENPSIVEPTARLKAFGQEDHVREGIEIPESAGPILDDFDDTIKPFGNGIGEATPHEGEHPVVVLSQRVDELTHRFESASKGRCHPSSDEALGRPRRFVFPELLELILQLPRSVDAAIGFVECPQRLGVFLGAS